MKTASVTIVALSLMGCSSPQERERAALMDSIEQSVRLPQGAKSLDAYVRYYAGPDKEMVAAIYMLPGLDDPPRGEGCDELRADGSSVPCKFGWPRSAELGPGKRVWLSNIATLPMPMRDAGDCGIVSVVYHVSERRFIEVTCFGAR